MAEAMQCNNGIYRVQEDNGQVYIYDSYDELIADYNIIGVKTPTLFLTFIVIKIVR